MLSNYTNRFRILKGGKISLVVSALLTTSSLFSAPSGGVVTSGTASISQSGNITNINQSTNKASINWNKFNIASNETVNFNQPNKNSITLNRVIGNEKSVINGALNANGQVWILNSNGVLFGKDARVNTSGLLATTKNLSDLDFQKGNYNFTGNSTKGVINQGTINIKNNGSIIFAANEVENSGVIKAVRGSVHLVGADEYSINLNGNSLVNLTVEKGVLDSLVKNSGTINAHGGEVYLTTNAVDELLKGVVNNTGVIEANSLDDVTGKVELFAHGGEAQVGGTISAIDGFVETSGKEFTILDDASISAGEWLIDPVDITIDDILASTIETALGSGDVIIQTESSNSTVNTSSNETSTDGDPTDGDIYVNSDITWSSANRLTLDADDEIYVNANINVTGNGTLALYYGQGAVNAGNTSDYHINAPVNLSSSSNFITKKGNDVSDLNWTIINNIYTLQNITSYKTYVLGSNIDASDTKNWNSGAGFNPIGNTYGTFDGLGHTVDSLYINRPTQDYVGLFGNTLNSTIKNIGLTDIEITGNIYVGGLVGANNSSNYGNSSISNSYVKGNITGNWRVGGLVGINSSYNGTSSISNSYTSVTVNSTNNDSQVGGLVGANNSSNNGTSSISNSYASGDVSGNSGVGGLVGINSSSNTGTSSIFNSYASGDVSGNSSVGGLVGINSSSNNTGTSSISNSYASGSVSGTSYLGGLVGWNSSNYGNSDITNSYWDIETNNGIMNDSSLGRTKAQISKLITGNEWSTAGAGGSSIEGYELYLPYLEGITQDEDKNKFTLFNSGLGTSDNAYTITNWTQLQNINFNTTTMSADYNLLNDLTKSTNDYTNIASKTANEGKGFNPIDGLEGNFDGLGHTIDSLTINRENQYYVGLFRYAYNSTIKNIGLTNVNITGRSDTLYIGGLVGTNSGIIENSYITGNVTGTATYANNIYPTGFIGGLVGKNNGTIKNSYSNVNVIENVQIPNVGGLVGWNDDNGKIINSYAIGTVKGTESNYSSAGIGGLVGYNSVSNGTSSISKSYWDTDTSTQTVGVGNGDSSGATGLNTAQMQDINTFKIAGWNIKEDSSLTKGLPILAWQNNINSVTWLIGTKVPKNNTPIQNNPTTQNNQNIVNKIVTPINNKTITKNISNTVKEQDLKVNNFKITQISKNKNVVASAIETNKNKTLVSLSDLKKQTGSSEIRVPLSDNSMITLVDNAINLPNGIEQEFYISDKK